MSKNFSASNANSPFDFYTHIHYILVENDNKWYWMNWILSNYIECLRKVIIEKCSKNSYRRFFFTNYSFTIWSACYRFADTFSTCTFHRDEVKLKCVLETGKTFCYEKMCIRSIDFYPSINLPWNFGMHQTSPSPSNAKTHIGTKQWMLRGFNEETFKCNSICGQNGIYHTKKRKALCNVTNEK